MSIDIIKNALPDYAKDIKLNLSSLMNEETLDAQKLWGTFVASAMAGRNQLVISEIVEEAGYFFIVDPHNVIQQVTVNSLNVGRNPKETLRLLDALQSDELCPCNRQPGGETIDLHAEAAKFKKAA